MGPSAFIHSPFKTTSEPVNLFTITSFFRREPVRVKKGLNAFNSDQVVNVNVLPGGIIKGKVQASMKKKIYQAEVHVESQKVSYSTCECPIGKDKCHHMAALLIWVEKNVSRTDVECVWKTAKTPTSDDILAKRVSVMRPSTSQVGIKTPVTQEVKDWTVSSLSQLGRFTGMWWILSPETAQTLPIKTWDGLVTSPGLIEAEDKALYGIAYCH